MTSRIAHIRRSGLTGIATLSVLATLGLTACSDSTSGSGSAAGSSAASGSASSGSSDSSGSGSGGSVQPASDITALAKQLATSTAQATSVHLTLATSGEGAAASAAAAGSGEGDVKTGDGGKTEAFTFQFGSGDTAFALIYADGTGYVKLPASEQTDPSKPWAQVSSSSSNPAVAAIAPAFDQVDKQTSLTQYATLVEGATNFQATGATEVNGQKAQGYSFDIDPSKLPNASQLGSAASQLGPIPATMALDEKGRPLQVVQKVTVSGQTITTTITFSDYDKAVDISAPPADQTTTG